MIGRFLRSLYVGRRTEYFSLGAIVKCELDQSQLESGTKRALQIKRGDGKRIGSPAQTWTRSRNIFARRSSLNKSAISA